MSRLECFFDCSSPWSYIGFHNAQALAKEFGIEISWRPILVGGVFKAVDSEVLKSRESSWDGPKYRYNRKDIADWARVAGLKIVMPPRIFPINSAKAMRACIIAGESGKIVPFATQVFEAYWSEDRDIAADDVLAALCKDVGLDGTAVLAKADTPEARQKLRDNGDELVRRGGFGAPTWFVDGDDMYFGNDRLVLVREALRRHQDRPVVPEHR